MDTLESNIQELRRKLNELNAQKEELFAKRNALSKQIVSKINTIKQLRQERDERTEQVKTLKAQRTDLNKGIGTVAQNLRGMNADKREAQKKLGSDPTRIKKKLDELNQRIETDVLDFKKEQQIMKQIRELEQQYKQSATANELFEHASEAAQELKTKKKEADSVHSQIQKLAEESQARHKKIVELSEEIDKLKAEEKTYNDPITSLKEQIKQLSEELAEKLGTVSKQRTQDKNAHKQRAYALLAKKQQEVQQKLERGEKLNTEDILILQSIEQE